jgi:hypothetical protein
MFDNIRIKNLVVAVIATLTVLMLGIGGMGMYSSANSVRLLKQVTLADERNGNERDAIRLAMETNRSQVLQALQHNPTLEWSKMHDHPLANHYKLIDGASEEVATRWKRYLDGISTSEEKALAEEWYSKSDGLGLAHIKAAADAIKAEQWDGAQQVLIKKINPSYRVGDGALKALSELAERRAAEHAAEVDA